ncbi:MAG: HTTM domain-containing protein [Chitinophagales bacterium]|nr:HTTM domain-containing protein [Chitinophagales bacterium]
MRTGKKFLKDKKLSFKEQLFSETANETLGLFRVLFSFLMFFEALRISKYIHRYYVDVDLLFKWDGFGWIPEFSENTYHFLAVVMMVSAICMMVSYYFRFFTGIYFILYLYFFLLDSSYYNNHYYFILLLLAILFFSKAGNWVSLQFFLKERKWINTEPVPYWNVFLIRYQVFLVYFIAGIVKLNADWMTTNTMRAVFATSIEYKDQLYGSEFMIYFLTLSGLVFDLSVGFLLLYPFTRILMIPAILVFHMMNAATLNIGVFPYLMAGSTMIFFRTDLIQYWKSAYRDFVQNKQEKPISFFHKKIGIRTSPFLSRQPFQRSTYTLILIFIILQAILPFRHFLIPGNVDWTGEGGHFAWRMKIGLKKPSSFDLFVYNKKTHLEYKKVDVFMNTNQFTHLILRPVRVLQLADYLGNKVSREYKVPKEELDIRVRSFVSMNGHPDAPLFDSTINLLEVKKKYFSHNNFITSKPTDIECDKWYWLRNFCKK